MECKYLILQCKVQVYIYIYACTLHFWQNSNNQGIIFYCFFEE